MEQYNVVKISLINNDAIIKGLDFLNEVKIDFVNDENSFLGIKVNEVGNEVSYYFSDVNNSFLINYEYIKELGRRRAIEIDFLSPKGKLNVLSNYKNVKAKGIKKILVVVGKDILIKTLMKTKQKVFRNKKLVGESKNKFDNSIDIFEKQTEFAMDKNVRLALSIDMKKNNVKLMQIFAIQFRIFKNF